MKTIIAPFVLCATPVFCAAIPASGGGWSECTQYGETSFRAYWTVSFGNVRVEDEQVNVYIYGTGYCGPVPTSASSPGGSTDGYATIGDFTSGSFSFAVGGPGGFLEVGRGPEMRRVDIIGWTSSQFSYMRDGDSQVWTYTVTITPNAPPVPILEPGGMALAGLLLLSGLGAYRRIKGKCSAARPGPQSPALWDSSAR